MSGLAQEKAELRKVMAARRDMAFAAGQGRAAEHLAAVLAPFAGQVLAGYHPIRSEIDPLPVLAGHAGPTCLPVVVGARAPLVFRAWQPGEPLGTGIFGTKMPVAAELLVPHLLIVPLLAFDARGYRLGYGGGFYDRTLAVLRAQGPVLAVGFAFAAQQVGAVPAEATDQPLDLVVTENGALRP